MPSWFEEKLGRAIVKPPPKRKDGVPKTKGGVTKNKCRVPKDWLN
jgi:hypothetical protein